MLAMSSASASLPSGTLSMNFCRFSGVSGIPVNISNRPVPDSSGHTLFTLIRCLPYSAAKPLVAFDTAPFEALYHTSPGRGRCAPVEEIFIIDPPCPCLIRTGMNN
ncbi:hypothetical protein H113_00678 [Trichophyton rubrum MR1459]|uniref:Uncharacterized protein n=1 Tax=Trichophyton rubrum (strain ATCC MYA-4607 / CBS 118892) TaxID=559305 RepID=A0A080WR63_TRIRC|nr:uncharacterized protein TERG_12594 [Trichophyton rubrum CBS 118892]EZF99686.1 hypothetical protein H113_00678 [Trichophyton rubrum MR1459]KFL62835.1 hypothetical protein TERG_12594 [Trichophyton rubrum CBS 118892]